MFVTVNLPQPWVDRLCQLPESGMGYQKARILLANGDSLKVTIFNADQFRVARRPPRPGHP